MLRSVVGATAANMMLVQCNSDVSISMACSVLQATVRTTASSEPRPWGTSKACRQAGVGWCPRSSDCTRSRTIGTEVGILDPHAMQNDTDAARQRNHRALRSSAAGNLCGPCSEPGRTATVHHNRRSLAQGATEVDVGGLGYPARDIALARLISRGRQYPVR